MTVPQPPSRSREIQEEVRATLAARQELGPDMDDALVDSFAQRLQGVIVEEVARQVGTQGTQNTKLILDWRKEMYAITLGCGIPLAAIAAIVGGGEGVLIVCVILAVVAIVVTGRTK